MQYSEVKEIMPKEELIKLCLILGKTPKEVVKPLIDAQQELDLWNHVHRESGELVNVKKINATGGSGYYMEVTFKSSKPDKYGKTEKTTRTGWQSNDDFYKKLCDNAHKYVKSYVSYVENPADNSAWRTLLDIEPAD